MDVQLDPEERRRRYCRLELTCPRCGGTGLIPWDRLEGLLHCRGCATWYRMAGDGRLVRTAAPPPSVRVSVRSGLGGWQDHRVQFATSPTSRAVSGASTRRRVARQFAVWGLLAILGVVIVLILRSAPSGPIDPPRSLEARAELLARAWLDRDVARMVRLTDATQDRALRRWLRDQPPPAPAGPSDHRSSGIAVLIRRQDDRTADVLVQVTDPEAPEGSPMRELRQRWRERQGDWYFMPGLAAESRMITGQDSRARRPRAPVRPQSSPSGSGSPARRKSLPS